MPRPRSFDHDEARRLYAAGGETYGSLAAKFGVSTHALQCALNPSYRERQDLARKRVIERMRQPCLGGCGRRVWMHKSGSTGYCPECHGRMRARTVRDDSLLCAECGRWKQDDDFPMQRRAKARRGRATICRSCQTIVRRRYRERAKATA